MFQAFVAFFFTRIAKNKADDPVVGCGLRLNRLHDAFHDREKVFHGHVASGSGYARRRSQIPG